MASNLGVIAKKGAQNKYYFAVTNILTTNTEANALIEVYNFQQQKIGKAKTDNEGLAIIDTNKHASFAIVSKGKNTTYVKLNDGNAISLSKFDVSGRRLQRGLKGYIYGERGVWRPGDTIHLTFILNDIANKLPQGHPVKIEITEPNGKLAYKHVTADNLNNFYKFTVPTAKESKTGNWNAKVSVGGAKFNKTLKIETVKPNRLKIKIDLEDEVLSSAKPLAGKLDVKWLHGAPGKNLKAEIKAKFSASYSSFKNYKEYVFHDPTRQFDAEDINVFEGNLNEEGLANINKKINVGKNAPGMLNAQFLVRAFENGGDFSMDAFTIQYAPFNSFVGLKSPKAKAYGSFFTDEDQTFDLVVVNEKGNPIKRNGLEVKVYKIEWRWWWNSSYDNLSSYVSNSYHRPFLNMKVDTDVNGKGSFKINVPDDEGGRFLIRVYDPKSGHATGRTAYFYKNWWKKAPSGDKDAAKMLVFAADKENYKVGETAKITFPSGTEGRALVSIENGKTIIQHQWVITKQGETTVDIPISPEMAPNVFINISLLQPHASTANDLPIRLFGVIPLMVENPKTKLEPQIRMPDVLRPEEEFTVIVSEKNNKPMTYTIAMVEEGLLDLTRFKTPNAWNEFYKREALGVKTWDIFDHVIGAYSGSIDQVYAIGGDGSAVAGKNQKANRIKPVVKFIGPFIMNSGDRKTHTIKMPNYVGAVRTMVVAGDITNESFGSTDKSVQVKKPLMVLATLPRKLSPGEKVTLPVTVFAMEPNVQNVIIDLKLSDGITVVGDNTKALQFEKPDEKMI
ncbi:MAG: MG2 domain-containing protein, partial [Draconibacterium sp.]|nr:MG2 domain-containing protein [Draconibacterium sp.]